MKRILRWLLAVSLAALLALAGAYAWFLSWLDAPGPSGQETVVLIPRGTGIAGIAQRLVQQQVVSHVKLLELAAWYTDTAGRLKAGEYLFRPQKRRAARWSALPPAGSWSDASRFPKV